MALTFPLSQATLGDILPVQIVNWSLRTFQELSTAGDGEFQAKDLAPPLWMGGVTLRPLLHTQARGMMAKLRALDGSINSFYLANPLGWYPAADPGGLIYGASTPQIATINANRKELTISGLPANYELTEGDFFTVAYAGGLRTAMFQIVNSVTASGAGLTPSVEVRPHISTGIVTTLPVNFAKPAAKVKIVPGTLDDSMHNANRTRISFQVRQTLQAGN
jgi:hypothetical protein